MRPQIDAWRLWSKLITIGVIAAVVCAVSGVWMVQLGNRQPGVFAITVAVVGVVALFMVALLKRPLLRLAQRHNATASGMVALGVAPDVALRWAREALHELDPDGAISEDTEGDGLALAVGRSWRSFGETVRIAVREDVDGSDLTVSSRCTGPQIADYGTNRQNVEAIVDALLAREAEVAGH